MARGGTPTRRDVLRLAGGLAGGLGASSVAGASPVGVLDGDDEGEDEEGREYNVGYSSPRGRRAAEDRSEEVVRRFDSIDVVTVRATEDAARGLRRNPHVRYVEENGEMELVAQSTPWGVDRIDAEVARADGDTGADVAIVDTGIDSDHPDLQAALGEGEAVVECGSGLLCLLVSNGNECDRSWDDDNDHGTHVAGIAGAVDNDRAVVGVSTRATLHAVKVLDCQGTGSVSDIAAGVEHVADRGWDVANMSLGGERSSALKDAVAYAAEAGVTLVAAAGNSGPCTDCVGYPAAYDEVVAVSATTRDDDLADFSSQGPEVELAAPGNDVVSTVPGGTEVLSGTSMAAPHVAGAAGRLAADGLWPDEVRATLRETAEDVGLAGDEAGAGLLDVAAALGFDSGDDR